MDYRTTDAELKAVADAIRSMTGSDAPIVYPNGFASEIKGIDSGEHYESADEKRY